MIANRVMKIDDLKNPIYYKIDCDCSNDDHITTIEFEYDKKADIIYVSFYKKLIWCDCCHGLNWFQRIYRRIKAALKIIFTGWIDVNESIILQNIDHIDGFIEALKEGKEYILEYQKENKR